MCNFYQGITTHKNGYDFVTISPIEVVSTKQAMKPAGAKLVDWINGWKTQRGARSPLHRPPEPPARRQRPAQRRLLRPDPLPGRPRPPGGRRRAEDLQPRLRLV